ncbi:MAG: nicotinate-nucleotide--dimethylbenzimidazole phosphoribosyltransferase [Christensenellaceae bacterium]
MIDTHINPLDRAIIDKARIRVDSLSKPLGSLGKLEDYAVQLAGIRGKIGGTLKNRVVLVFAADNGIHAQGITPVPKAVTPMQSINIANGIAGVNVLAKASDTKVLIYNVGIEPPIVHPNIINVNVMRGTKDISTGPAMSREQCEFAMQVGFDAVAKNLDMDIFGLGEMGICNTSTTAAVAAVLLGQPAELLTGKGAGITDEQYALKTEIINRAIRINNPDKNDVVDVLSKVGGLDIAAMTGAYIACAHYAKPVVIDGFISACAALCAVKIAPLCKEYLFASHKSFEQGYVHIMDEIGISPAFTLEMRLGEGSGCPLMFHILESSLHIISEMGTFEQGNINPDDYIDLRK